MVCPTGIAGICGVPRYLTTAACNTPKVEAGTNHLQADLRAFRGVSAG